MPRRRKLRESERLFATASGDAFLNTVVGGSDAPERSGCLAPNRGERLCPALCGRFPPTVQNRGLVLVRNGDHRGVGGGKLKTGGAKQIFFLHPIAESNKSIIFAINMTSHASRRTAHPGRSSSFYIVASY